MTVQACERNLLAQGREVSKQEWVSISTPDVYFSHAYYQTSAFAEPDFARIVLLEWRDEKGVVHLPLIVRQVPGEELFDATSAYGYGGPWVTGSPDLDGFRKYFDAWARENSVVTSFIRFHPLLGNGKRFSEVFPIKSAGKTAVWNIQDNNALIEGMHKSHRKNWRRAGRAGVEVSVTVAPSSTRDFRSVYETTMSRLAARTFYWFPDEYWETLGTKLRNNSLLVEAVYEGKVIASVWCLFTNEYLHFHLSGTTNEGRRLGGAFICRVAAAEWARDAGLRLAHHGGGTKGSGTSLLEWKQRFDESAPLLDFQVAEVIHNEDVYKALSESLPVTSYFPVWRSPEVRRIHV